MVLQAGKTRPVQAEIVCHQHHNDEYLRRRGFIFSSGFKSGTTWGNRGSCYAETQALRLYRKTGVFIKNNVINFFHEPACFGEGYYYFLVVHYIIET